jgi:hypothetical protein
MVVAKQWCYNHVSVATEADATTEGLAEKKQATEELLEMVFRIRSAPRLYTKD